MIHLARVEPQPRPIDYEPGDGDGDCPKIEFKSYLVEPDPPRPEPDDITFFADPGGGDGDLPPELNSSIFFAGPDEGGGLPPEIVFSGPKPPPMFP